VFGSPTAPHLDGPAADHAVGYCGTAEGALRQLDEGHDAWIQDVRRLGAAGLAMHSRNRMTQIQVGIPAGALPLTTYAHDPSEAL
jgi:hypothetical protein